MRSSGAAGGSAKGRGRHGAHLADVAADEHGEHQVAVALVGGVGHAVLEGARRLQHECGRALQDLGRRELERDPCAVGHLGDVAAVLDVQLEPDPLRLVKSVGARAANRSGRWVRLIHLGKKKGFGRMVSPV
eukprot:scaffold50788_cov68-Phaeocystis_antarctica.AAC.10